MVSAPSLITAVLTGPTAAGKTALALEIARSLPGRLEIVNADSMLVYQGMDIGTAKPSRAELEEIPHHLIDIRRPDQPFTAGEFVRETHAAIQDIEAPSASRIGRTDRYRLIRALELIELSGKTPTQLQSELPVTADPRLELWVLDRAPSELEARIQLRCVQMLRDGLIGETQRVAAAYPGARSLGAVGYKEVCAYLEGVLPEGRKIPTGEAGLKQEIELATRQLVKRQRTWFRGLQAKLGPACHWFDLPTETWRKELLRAYNC
jgi:tRNA dimethylallyltransferase